MWFYLSLSKFFNKLGNYFYNLHVLELRIKQKKDSENWAHVQTAGDLENKLNDINQLLGDV